MKRMDVAQEATDRLSVDAGPHGPTPTADGWPADGSPADFCAITDPVVSAIRQAYRLSRRNRAQDIDWTGLDIGQGEHSTCRGAAEQLLAENLAYAEEDQGRDALEEIVGLAVRLGIEQGRRIFRQGGEHQRLLRFAETVRGLLPAAPVVGDGDPATADGPAGERLNPESQAAK